VLVVEDYEVLARSIGTGLRREVLPSMWFSTERRARPSCGHPLRRRGLGSRSSGVHGDEVCRRIVSERCDSRVLMLTAASTVEDRVEGLGLGADDYLPKPFDFSELVARVRALGRRSTPARRLRFTRDMTLDPTRRVAFRAGRRLELSPKEFAFSSVSSLRATESFRLRSCWNGSGTSGGPVTTAVKTTSAATDQARRPPVIHTVREGGYRIGDK